MVRATKAPGPLKLPAIDVRWELRACAGSDPDLFFDQDLVTEPIARDICWTCPIRLECLTWALETKQEFGMWGGMSEKQRKFMSVPRHRVKCPGCGSFDVSPALIRHSVEVCEACGLSWNV